MKREAISHTKVTRLAQLLAVEKWGSIGIMESLWHLTSRQAPSGNIGKLDDVEIASGLGWLGDATQLVDALVAAKLLDHSEEHRLTVHDWSEHAEDSVHMRLARAGRLFCDGKQPKLTKLPIKEREAALVHYEKNKRARRAHKSAQNGTDSDEGRLPKPLPKPKPSPLPKSSLSADADEMILPGLPRTQFEEIAMRIQVRHPAVRRCAPSEARDKLRSIASRFPAKERLDALIRLDKNHEAMCSTQDWQKENGQFAKGLANWLAPTKDRWEIQPEEHQSRPQSNRPPQGLLL